MSQVRCYCNLYLLSFIVPMYLTKFLYEQHSNSRVLIHYIKGHYFYCIFCVNSVSVPIIATFCPFALQVGRTSPWSNDTTDLGKGSIKLQASIVWKGWLKSFSSYRRFYRTKSIGDNKNGQPDYRHHSKRSILR